MLGAIGILGGTFDPIHVGHLRLAQEVAEALNLSAVRFVPGGTPPHRATPQTPAADRVAMVKLAVRASRTPSTRCRNCARNSALPVRWYW